MILFILYTSLQWFVHLEIIGVFHFYDYIILPEGVSIFLIKLDLFLYIVYHLESIILFLVCLLVWS